MAERSAGVGLVLLMSWSWIYGCPEAGPPDVVGLVLLMSWSEIYGCPRTGPLVSLRINIPVVLFICWCRGLLPRGVLTCSFGPALSLCSLIAPTICTIFFPLPSGSWIRVPY